MQRQLFTLVFSALAMMVVSARADTLCDHVRRYVHAPFGPGTSRDGLPDRQIEMHWVGFWLDFDRGFGKTCVHSGVTESRDLCAWLMEHSSTEFPSNLPFGILECYGYNFPRPYPDWSQWKVQIYIWDERWMTLDVDFTGWKTETGAIRLGVYADDETPWGDRPPLAPLPKSEQSTDPDGPAK